MEKILGIDTGTNSLGWAIVEKDGDEYRLLDKGTNIFSEGVKVEKGIESSKASERTGHRSLRKHYWRRKVRKIRLLTILVENELCPKVSQKALREWRLKKNYPMDDDFLGWQRTDEKEGKNPYHYRYICLTEKLDLSKLSQRYILGRALYHLNQRRGFLSNRKESTAEVDGKVKTDIASLSDDIEKAGCSYLGEYFYKLYQRGARIRKHYTARKEHYLKEFHAICEKQELDASFVEKLEKAIFFQRPLKSQKGTVGKCTFEKDKPRCPSSHPLFEDFRMYQFINSIKIEYYEGEWRQLTEEEKSKIIPKFKRKSKKKFPFEDIAKELAGKKNYCYFKDKEQKPYKFNYPMDTSVSGSVVNAQLEEIFGSDWKNAVCEVYTLSDGKTQDEIVNDVWHALFFYDDEEKLKGFAKNRLQLSDEESEKFCKITLPSDYAALSMKAIRKILPYMRDYGLIYSKAVYLANLGEVIPQEIWENEEARKSVIDDVKDVMENVEIGKLSGNLGTVVREYLSQKYGVDENALNRLYHPSMLEHYPQQRSNSDGIFQLGSPRINSVRNPMAMHSLFRLRKVVNLLLKEGKIDEKTIIHIEFARELNDANKRKAIKFLQKINENDRDACRKKIEELGYTSVSDTDILKYQLWEEQGHQCLYTGEQIGVKDFLGENPKYDIEHTIPRSAGGDSTKENMTLCSSKFNREVKRTKLPTALPDYDEILMRIEFMREKYESLDKQIRAIKRKSATTKEQRDSDIQKRHQLKMQRDYWKGKYERFTMEEVPEGFARRQGAGIGLISRYARLYLKSVFEKVYVVKGNATAEFRKIWGIQEEYTKKERVNHVHHCIDAITIACIGLDEHNKLAHFYHQVEEYRNNEKNKPQFVKPWPTFTEDVMKIQDELLVAHYSQDNMPKHTRKRVGKTYIQGDTARTSLHNETYYGAIEKEEEVKYVVRKPLDGMEEKDVKNIVDDVVRQKREDAIAKYGSLKKAVESTIWMNEQLQIPIKKVRIYAKNVVRPLQIRQQRDQSRKEYKRQYHVENDRNYLMAIYIGKDKKGKEKRDFVVVNNLEAAKYYRRSNNAEGGLVPDVSEKNGFSLAYCLKIGTMVLLYEKSPEEIWLSDKKAWQRRLYKVTGLSSLVISSYVYGTISLIHHQEARRSSEVKLKNGAYASNEELRSGIKMYHTQINALVEGVDFVLNDLGEIKRLR